MTSSVLANSKYLQGRLLALIDPTREANRVLIARCARLEVQGATRYASPVTISTKSKISESRSFKREDI